MSSNFFSSCLLNPNTCPLCFSAAKSTSTFSSIVLSFRLHLVSSFSWLISLGLCRAKLWSFFSWKAVMGNRVSRKLWLIWVVWLERNRRVSKNSSGDFSVVWDSVFYFVASWSKLTTPFLFFHSNHLVLIFDQLSFLMRTILNFII